MVAWIPYFIKPNIYLTSNAESQAKESYISDEDIYLTINHWDHEEPLGNMSYKRTKKFYQYSVNVYCRWKDSQKCWWVGSCFKRSQK